LHSSEAQHCSLSSADRQMRVLTAIVQPTPNLLSILISKLIHRGFVGAQAVRSHGVDMAMAFNRLLNKSQNCVLVMVLCDVALQHHPRLVDRSTQTNNLGDALRLHHGSGCTRDVQAKSNPLEERTTAFHLA